MKARFPIAFLCAACGLLYDSAPIILTGSARAATNDLTGLLQKGLFEEEANRNLDAAAQAYQTVSAQFDKDRALAATAIFRLGEIYRKQNKTNEAVGQYERIVREFADQNTLVTLSRQNLAGLRPARTQSSGPLMPLEDLRSLLDLARMRVAAIDVLPKTNRTAALASMFSDDDIIETFTKQRDAAAKQLEVLLQSNNADSPPVRTAQSQLQSIQTRIDARANELEAGTRKWLELSERALKQREAAATTVGGQSMSYETTQLVAQLKGIEQFKDNPEEQARAVLAFFPDETLKKMLLNLPQLKEQEAILHANSSADRDTKFAILSSKLGGYLTAFGPDGPVREAHYTTNLVADTQFELRNQLVMIKERVDFNVGVQKARLQVLQTATGNAPVFQAATAESSSPTTDDEEKEIRRIQDMIKNSPDLINAPQGGITPLIKAATAGQLRVAAFLLDHQADVNLKANSLNPLCGAAVSGNKAMVELLLSRGADINAKDGGGRTALHTAVASGFMAVAETLLQHKADVNARDSEKNGQQTPLHLAAGAGLSTMMELLLHNGANVNAVDKEGQTPLMQASWSGRLEAVKILLAAKADVNLQSTAGRTALCYAAGGYVDVVKALLEAKADPNAGTLDLPLTMAAMNGRSEIAELLLRAGAKPDLASKTSEFADAPGRYSPTNFRGTSPFGPYTPLQIAVSKSDTAMVKLLFKFKADANAKEPRINPIRPLVGYSFGNPEILQAFLEAGADANADSAEGWPLLISACQQSNARAVELLLAHGAKTEAKGPDGQTPLSYAAQGNCLKCVELLLATKADVNAAAENGWTCLHLAVYAGHKEIAGLLLAKGANPNVRNKNGQTPLDLTKSQPGTGKQKELAELLRQHGALDDLPDFNSIRITRQGLAQPFGVFAKGPKLPNQFTLLESLMNFYRSSVVLLPGQPSRPANVALPFPDFGRVIIRRPSHAVGGKDQEIKVSLLNPSNAVDCAMDVPVEFGDVIEIPERVHALNETLDDPVREMEWGLVKVTAGTKNPRVFRDGNRFPNPGSVDRTAFDRANTNANWTCLLPSVQLVVAGQRTTLVVDSWKEGFLGQALAKTEARAVLRSSSDLSRVKVSRQDPKTGKPVVLTVDVSGNPQPNDDLWLRDGDVIEVPDKP